MIRLSKILFESLELLLKNPKLFIPKFVLATLYGLQMLWIASIYEKLFFANSLQILSEKIDMLSQIFVEALFLLAFFILTIIINILIDGMYSVIVKDYLNKKPIRFLSSLKFAFSHAKILIPATLLSLIIASLLSLPFSIFFNFILMQDCPSCLGNSLLLFFVFLALTFVLGIIFYLLYPVSLFEAKSPIKALLTTTKLGLKNIGVISKAVIFPFSVSLLNIILAFLSSESIFLLLFIFLRIMTAIISTYHLVLNPTIYFKYNLKK